MSLLPLTRWFIAQADPGWVDITLYLVGPMYFIPYLALTVAAGLHLAGVKDPILAGIAVAPSYYVFLLAFHIGGGPEAPRL